MIWPTDPKTGQPSVSLGILLLATLVMVIAVGINIAGYAKSTDLVVEFWMGSAGLYWGRKFASKDGAVLEEAQAVEQQLQGQIDQSSQQQVKNKVDIP